MAPLGRAYREIRAHLSVFSSASPCVIKHRCAPLSCPSTFILQISITFSLSTLKRRISASLSPVCYSREILVCPSRGATFAASIIVCCSGFPEGMLGTLGIYKDVISYLPRLHAHVFSHPCDRVTQGVGCWNDSSGPVTWQPSNIQWQEGWELEEEEGWRNGGSLPGDTP